MSKDERQIGAANALILIWAKEALKQANLLKAHLGRRMKKDGVLRTGFNLLETNVDGIVASIEMREQEIVPIPEKPNPKLIDYQTKEGGD